jgi:hypothetical protein
LEGLFTHKRLFESKIVPVARVGSPLPLFVHNDIKMQMPLTDYETFSLSVNLQTIGCLIEGHSTIDDRIREFIDGWLKAMSAELPSPGKKYTTYIQQEVTDAASNWVAVWEAIVRSNHVWFYSEFAGESIFLFEKTLVRARNSGIRNRVVFNLARRRDALDQLISRRPELCYVMKWLEERRNIQFVFFDEILPVLGGRQLTYQKLQL